MSKINNPIPKIFKDSNKLLEMLMLRKTGFSFNFLAYFYKCDRTSLRYQCRKYQVFPSKKKYIRNDKSSDIFNPNRIANMIIMEIAPEKVSNWIVIDGERINTGKNYSDYLKSNSPYKVTV